MSDLVVENYDEFAEAFNKAVFETARDAELAVHRLGDDIAARERADAPVGEGWHARDSITVTEGRGDHEYFVDVGPSKRGFYFAFAEFGTRHQPARPFMRPAIASAVAAWRP